MPEFADSTAGLYSSFGGDPDLAELVELFVDELPSRIDALKQAFAVGDMDALRRAAHQMKGAAGSYGFEQVTPLAASLEASVRQGEPEQNVLRSLQELVGVCRLLRAGQPS